MCEPISGIVLVQSTVDHAVRALVPTLETVIIHLCVVLVVIVVDDYRLLLAALALLRVGYQLVSAICAPITSHCRTAALTAFGVVFFGVLTAFLPLDLACVVLSVSCDVAFFFLGSRALSMCG
jgi:hypothetical protein